jgi:ABC-2 type transport system permease protein
VAWATAVVNFKTNWRFFGWTSFALRFFTPVMILSAAWVLYNSTFQEAQGQLQRSLGISSYISFITTGNALFAFVFASAFVVGRVMFWERVSGTIEATFVSPMNRLAYMTGVMTAATVNSFLDVAVVFLVGFLFGFRVLAFDINLFLAGLGLFVFAMFGVGLIINGVTLTFRDRTTTANSMTVLLLAFSGVVAPISLMPQWAQVASWFSPLTYGIVLIRDSLGVGTVSTPAGSALASLAILGVVYVFIGSVMLRAIERNLRKKALFSVF